MSASESKAPSAGTKARVTTRILWRLMRRSWATLRESRLGMAGFFIVLIFGFIAVLAPVISPYPKDFLAPTADRFVVNTYNQTLPPASSGLVTYNVPVMGPTTPLSDDKQGGMWEINSRTDGVIYMDFLLATPGVNESPYQRGGHLRLTFDITQSFGVVPLPGTPLRAVYYIVPGTNVTSVGRAVTAGPGVMNGLLAAFAGRTFLVVDPWTNKSVFNYTLPFDPIWTGEDPASAGQMVLTPLMRLTNVGIRGVGVGPYRYLYASDGNHTALFEVTYCHEGCEFDNFPALPFGRLVGYMNNTLSAPPFIYFNQEWTTQWSNWRTGPGQSFVVPLSNNTLAIYNVTGQFLAWVPLTLNGEPALVDGQIGFTQSTYPLFLYLPLHSARYSGLAVYDVVSRRIKDEYSFADPSLVPNGIAANYRGNTTYFAFYNATINKTHLFGLYVNVSTGALNPLHQFDWNFGGRILSYFAPPPDARPVVFIYTQDHKLYTMDTTFGLTAVTPQSFAVFPPKSVDTVIYAGSFGGTIWGPALAPTELFGLWTDGQRGLTVAFQLLGTPRAPLPPGTYPSGNTYLLGTDFKGGDIVTQLFYGAQVAFIVGILAALFAVGIGTLVGLLAGYYGRITDTLLMRTTDVFLVLPFLPVVLVLEQIMRPSIWVIIIIIAILGWPGIARVVRSQVLTLKERPFVDAARVSGASDLRVAFLHIAPNVLPFSFLYMSLNVSGAIITEAILSFLGLGDPYVTSWGAMLSNVLTQGGALSAWWWLIPPGLCITLLSLGFYLLGRGFDEIINPRLRRR